MKKLQVIHETINVTDVPLNGTFYARMKQNEYWWIKITKYTGRTINKIGEPFERSFKEDYTIIIEKVKPTKGV